MRKLFSHHAHVLPRGTVEDVAKLLDEEGAVTKGNPDFYCIECESLGVDQSREVAAIALRKPFGEQKIIVLSFESATGEAQNALLKTLEEPVADTYFFICVPDEEVLLPTVRSRLSVLSPSTCGREDDAAHTFLRAEPSDRIAMLAAVIKDKDRASAHALLNGLEKVLHDRGVHSAPVAQALEHILYARGALRGRAPSYKLLLESVALITPVINTTD